MKKKLVLIVCLVSCLMMASGCSLVKENENFKQKDLEQNAGAFVNQWFGYDFASTVEQYQDQMTSDQIEQYQNYSKLQKEHGQMKKLEKTEYTASSDAATVTLTVSTEKKGKLIFTVTYDETAQISDWKVEEYQSVGAIMGKAGLNTVMSMAIVFVVLIFISLLIASFQFIGTAQRKQENAVSAPAPATPEPAAQAPDVGENPADDLELAAVIAAAIAAASESGPTDGLVVRSIVRRS